MSLWSRVTDMLYPPRCVMCGVPGTASPCAACACDIEYMDGPTALPDGWTCLAPYEYGGAVSRAVKRLKFQGRAATARDMGRLMADCARENGITVDCVCAVPMLRAKQNERGYNQAELLGRAVARELGLPFVKPLIKARRTETQSSLSAALRADNVRSAYKPSRGAGSVSGLRVLLVDDVCTTGATLSECARVLIGADARSVCALTFAKTVAKTGVPVVIKT